MSAWDTYYGLSTHKWKLYKCSDCDPELVEDEDVAEGAVRYDEPYRIIIQHGADVPSYCPRCDSYLSLLDVTAVLVTMAPRESHD